MTDRTKRWGEIAAQLKTWSIPGVLEVDGPADQALLQEFLDHNIDLKEALAQRIRDTVASLDGAPAMTNAPALPASGQTQRLNELRMSAAVEQFVASKQVNGENSRRTVRDKRALLHDLSRHVSTKDPSLGEDPLVHVITTPHLSSFLDEAVVRRTTTSPGEPRARHSPKTLLKKISDLRSFFEYAHTELHATAVDPTVGLTKRSKALRSASSKQEQPYDPFQTEHLKLIFEPKAYLAFNRHADYFWAPLLGLHLGTRLKEVVTLAVDAVGVHEPTGIWYIDVRPEEAKNENSIRRLPLPERLIGLGFVKYVEHVRRLGATRLFPFRNLDLPTVQADPSKNCSRKFAKYLDSLGLVDRALVFHSFRHTVVTALQDGGTPIADSMQLVGHQAQELAMRTGHLTPQQARSVHLDNYSHADKPRLGVEHAIQRLQQHLERCVQVPLDYDRLARAAEIVREHTRFDKHKFRSGWPPQRRAYTERQVGRIG